MTKKAVGRKKQLLERVLKQRRKQIKTRVEAEKGAVELSVRRQ